MKILVTGSTGLIGSALVSSLTSSDHTVRRLLRPPRQAVGSDAVWDPAAGTLDQQALEGIDAVVHLAGENIAGGRWTSRRKARIRDSRVNGTRLLSETLSRLPRPPSVWVSASAIGYYGNRGDTSLNEGSPAGSGFLSDVCRDWEAATKAALQKGIRVVNLRIGIVLSPAGGALAKMLLPFKMGVGGKVGDGKQFMSWIALDDIVGVIQHALTNERLTGPVNAVSPNPVTNLQFTRTLGSVLRRPTIFPMPALAARMAFGEMADELLLSSTRVQPARLTGSGFQFRYPSLESALRHLLHTDTARSAA
ncbi:MAG: TIGR01777 family oxidoreductase [Acidobacteriota bacterium]|nr:TIGR01777 family oxidoreductase [Acidobacteriota bacterium]